MKEDQFTQILRAINDVRDDVKEFKNEMNRRWDENDRRWDENDKRWAENEKRWKANDKEISSIRNELQKINERIEKRYKDTLGIFEAYENSVENMYQENRERIIVLEKRLKIANA